MRRQKRSGGYGGDPRRHQL
jgi:hypothetical protein